MPLRPAPFLLTAALLAACAPSVAAAPPADLPGTVVAATLNVQAMYTQAALAAFESRTATALAMLPTLTPTPTPVTALDFRQARLAGVSLTAGGGLIVILELPGLNADHGRYIGRTGQGDFECERDPAAERLICVGPRHDGPAWVTFALMPADQSEDLFIVRILAPAPVSRVTPVPVYSLAFYQNNPYCEVEPLYQPDHPHLPQFQDPALAGCYAITCGRYDHSGVCGTKNTCISMPPPPCP